MALHTEAFICLILWCALILPSIGTKRKDIELERNAAFCRAELFMNNDVAFKSLAAPAFTFCIHVKVDYMQNKHHDVTILSYSSKEAALSNEILLEVDIKKNQTQLFIHDNYKPSVFNGLPPDKQWSQICATWNNKDGKLMLFIDGNKMGEAKNVYTGKKIGGDGYLILGHDQDYYNGAFELEEGLTGKLSNFQYWDKSLNFEGKFPIDCSSKGDLVNWDNTTWRFYGGARVLPTDAPCTTR